MEKACRRGYFLSFSLISAAALALSAMSSLTACGGETTGGTGGGSSSGGADCFDYANFDGTMPAVSFATDVLPIFRNSCSVSNSCHQSETASAPQHYLGPSNSQPDPTADQILAILSMVGKAATEEPAMKVVEAGKPETSFLMYKLDGLDCSALKCASDNSCGTIMPQGGSKLSQDQRDIVRRWIAQGAQNN